MTKYKVVPFMTGCIGGSIDENQMTSLLNENAGQGWRLVHTIHETKKIAGIFQREAHFLIFEKSE